MKEIERRDFLKGTKLAVAVAALVFAVALVAAPSIAEDFPPAPVASPDVYKVLAENDQWRVIESTWQPGQEDKFHSHPADRVSLYKTNCNLRLTKPDGTYREYQKKAGVASVRTGKPVKAHKAKNIGDKICTIWIIELK